MTDKEKLQYELDAAYQDAFYSERRDLSEDAYEHNRKLQENIERIKTALDKPSKPA